MSADSPLCDWCHEPYVEPHDPRRCKTITRAWILEDANMGDEISYEIVHLVRWLQEHPPRPSARQTQARAARQEFLDHYVKLAQQ